MEYIKIYIIVQMFFLFFQYFYSLKLQPFQYCELVFGSFFIILFFGIFASILIDESSSDNSLLNNSALFAIFYSIWIYITKKITNAINSDNNGVINY
jgi:hypothetical protein